MLSTVIAVTPCGGRQCNALTLWPLVFVRNDGVVILVDRSLESLGRKKRGKGWRYAKAKGSWYCSDEYKCMSMRVLHLVSHPT